MREGKRMRDVSEVDASIIVDTAGDELWVFGEGGLVAIGTATGGDDSGGLAVAFDAAGLALVIAELSRRLHGMLAAQLPVKSEEPAPAPERPISEMSREEIREELGAIIRTHGVGVADAIDTMDAIERGPALPWSLRTRRSDLLAQELAGRVEKAATPT